MRVKTFAAADDSSVGRLNENATEVVTRARGLVFWPASVVAEVGDPVLVDAEVVGELVQDGDADLPSSAGSGKSSTSGRR